MVDAEHFTRMAMALAEVTSAPHFDRIAFKVKRIFATLAGDGRSVNLKLTPDEQAFKCQLAPDVFRPIDNGWGRQGWTAMDLAAATEADVQAALEMAYAHAVGPAKKR
ncbi:hypothetical protein ASG47_19245 [Devosia sp. Leaf420]|uniref:MmcQ/YjbR family DNA-binding protein n=1 Tax=Devosia sp. Leaf420 TaxID=1736374 RepID=UPI000714A553|nr:MmcQ/YjbR family DNA-binding protein [Devosia sp. Leaf420]KQT51079.1 hypothetical protein ASG47_19245 [Devosia sp. Leaf420]